MICCYCLHFEYGFWLFYWLVRIMLFCLFFDLDLLLVVWVGGGV